MRARAAPALSHKLQGSGFIDPGSLRGRGVNVTYLVGAGWLCPARGFSFALYTQRLSRLPVQRTLISVTKVIHCQVHTGSPAASQLMLAVRRSKAHSSLVRLDTVSDQRHLQVGTHAWPVATF